MSSRITNQHPSKSEFKAGKSSPLGILLFFFRTGRNPPQIVRVASDAFRIPDDLPMQKIWRHDVFVFIRRCSMQIGRSPAKKSDERACDHASVILRKKQFLRERSPASVRS